MQKIEKKKNKNKNSKDVGRMPEQRPINSPAA